jgi:hypothetical protein
MNKRLFILVILSFIFILAFSVYWLRLGWDIVSLREGIYLSTSGIAVIGGIFALVTYGFKGPRTTTLFLLTMGIAYWFIGDTLFSYYQFILKIDPFPSLADAFYLTAYPFLLFGLINEVKAAKANWGRFNQPIAFLFGISATLLAIVVSYFGIFLAYDAKETLFANIIAMSYGVGDLLLILANMFVLILVWEFRGGKLSRVWLTLFVSFVLTLIADILFALFTVQYKAEMWFYKSLLDSLWMLSYLIFAYALFDLSFSLTDAFQRIKSLEKKK